MPDLARSSPASVAEELLAARLAPLSGDAQLAARPSSSVVTPSQAKLAKEHAKVEEELRDIENQILKRSLSVVHSAISFAEIDEHELTVPQEWIDEYGEKEATKRFRIAQGAWRSTKEAPNGILVAMKIAGSIVQARSAEKVAPKALSITWIQNQNVTPAEYPEIIDVKTDI